MNNGASLAITGNGSFTFPDGLASGANYQVTIASQPQGPAQVCTLDNAGGQIGAGNVTDVAVTCAAAPTHTVGGNVTGLIGSVALKLNNGPALPISADGAFTFQDGVAEGIGYVVSIATQPSSQACTVANGSGTMGTSNVTNVAVTCVTVPTYTVGGTVSGLTGSGLTVKLNGGTAFAISADGGFTFPDHLTGGTPYAVTVSTQPSGQTCGVSNGSGQIGTADVTGVLITCAAIPPQMYTVGGRVSGLLGSGLVLQINGGATLPMSANGLFVFTGGLPSGATYAITIATSPSNPTQICTVTNGSGTVGSANVTDVVVTCAAPITDRIFADGFEDASHRM